MTAPFTSRRRQNESQTLFNPAFMAVVSIRAVEGHQREAASPIIMPMLVVAASMAVDAEIRQGLSRTVRTQLGKWRLTNPRLAHKIPRLVDIHTRPTRAGIILAVNHELLTLEGARVQLGSKSIRRSMSGLSDEVAEIQRAATYIGRWLALNGSPSTVLALLGVRV